MNLYAYVGNDPLNATDPRGTKIYIRIPDPTVREKVKEQLERLKATRTGAELYEEVDSSEFEFFIVPEEGSSWVDPTNKEDGSNNKGTGGLIRHDPEYSPAVPIAGGGEAKAPGFVILGHELKHAAQYARGTVTVEPVDPETNENPAEEEARETENKIRKEAGLPESFLN